MKILMVGGTGHTGERVVRRFLRAGHQVTVLSRRSDGDPVLAGLIRAGATTAEGDCTRLWTLFEALAGFDALVSCSHVKYAEACVAGCKATGVRRYLQMSSTRRFTRFPCETSRQVIAGESAIEKSGLDYTILRATMIFGGKRDANLTRLCTWFRKHSWFPLFGDGSNLVQPVFTEDVADAIVAAIDRPAASKGRSFTLAGPNPLSHREFLEITARACGVRKLSLIRIPRGPAMALVGLLPDAIQRRGLSAEQIQRMAENKDADISAAKEALGFAPLEFAEAMGKKVRGEAEVA